MEDVAAATWAAAEWISQIGRQAANTVAGEDIYFANDKAKCQSVRGSPDAKAKLTAPFFNLVSQLNIIRLKVSIDHYAGTGRRHRHYAGDT